MLKIKMSLSSAEVNILLEAIDAANKAVANGQQVYCNGGYQAETTEIQQQYANMAADIAANLQNMIVEEETAIIAFEP